MYAISDKESQFNQPCTSCKPQMQNDSGRLAGANLVHSAWLLPDSLCQMATPISPKSGVIKVYFDQGRSLISLYSLGCICGNRAERVTLADTERKIVELFSCLNRRYVSHSTVCAPSTYKSCQISKTFSTMRNTTTVQGYMPANLLLRRLRLLLLLLLLLRNASTARS